MSHMLLICRSCTQTSVRLTLGAGDLERRRLGLLRGGVLRRCLSLGGDVRRLGGERGKRPLGDTALQSSIVKVSINAEADACMFQYRHLLKVRLTPSRAVQSSQASQLKSQAEV